MIRYRLRQVSRYGEVWVSSHIFEATTAQVVKQAVIAGFITGEPRQAETESGELIYGLDAKGKEIVK